jgi:hypothetical protein
MRVEVRITVTRKTPNVAVIQNVLSNERKENIFLQNVSREHKEYSYVRYVACNTESSVL